MEEKKKNFKVICIGAGPAGLTLAHTLTHKGVSDVMVIEADPAYVGGIARTVEYKGFRFDIGGHRFFSKSTAINQFWREILGDDLLVRSRSSKILYNKKYYSYPLKPVEALLNLGLGQTLLCLASYFYAQLRPIQAVVSFQDWMINHFGRRFFSIFFKTYTEKVWGMSCTEISADWAQKRIKDLSLMRAVLSALAPKSLRPQNKIKSLIEEFYYPRLGPGMLWEKTADKVQERGGQILMGNVVTKVQMQPDGLYLVTAQNGENHCLSFTAEHVISTCPLRQLVCEILENTPQKVRESAGLLRYRDFITVALIVQHRSGPSSIEGENWVYIHDTTVQVARIQNFKKWSEELVPQKHQDCYGLEYFTNVGDSMWERSDADWIVHAKKEFTSLGLAEEGEIIDAIVIRQPKAYPVYDEHYKTHLANIKNYLDEYHPNIQLVGRNGMHRYNNQDHSMMTAHLAALNILAKNKNYDVWSVDQDAEYHEENISKNTSGRKSTSGLRQVPEKLIRPKDVTTQSEL